MRRKIKPENRIRMLFKTILVCVAMLSLIGCGDEKQKSNYEQGVEALETQNYSNA